MQLKIRARDYVPDGIGGLQRVSGREEVLERVLYRLSVPRGSFPFDAALGSRLQLLGREKTSERLNAARKYVTEALAEEKDITVTGVALKAEGNDLLRLTVSLKYQEEDAAVSVLIGE